MDPDLKLRAPRFQVSVTAEIVETSKRRDSSHCMTAEGIKIARPAARFVSLDIQTIRFTEGRRRFVYLTPLSVQKAIINFDQGRTVPPFRFQLRNGQSTPAGRRAKESARLVKTREGSGKPGCVPDKLGGERPPKQGGVRRSFGLRAFEL